MALALAVGASGDVFELPLNCAGFYDINTPAWTMDFDLGVTFSEISHVYIDWSGEIRGALAESYYNPGNPYPLDEGIDAYLGSNPSPRLTEVWGGQETYPALEPFDQISTFTLYHSSSWSDLFDGKGTIMIDYEGLRGTGDWYYIERGSITLNNATLIFEGTIIPEPTSLFLIVLGGLWITRKSRINKFN
jgi:hypothetical protein